jgi:hypothetical protein
MYSRAGGDVEAAQYLPFEVLLSTKKMAMPEPVAFLAVTAQKKGLKNMKFNYLQKQTSRARLNIERDLGQELVTRAMDRMKVLGMGRLCFQFLAQLQNVVVDSPGTRIFLVSPHFIE